MSLEKYRAIVRGQQLEIERLVRARGLTPVRAIYDDLLRELVAALAHLPPGFDRTVKEGLLAQVRATMARLVGAGGGALAAGSAAAHAAAASAGFRLLNQMEREFAGAVVPLPLREIAVMRGVTARAPNLLTVHRRSLARYGARVVGEISEQTSIGLALGENTSKIIDRVQGVADVEWWQGERIVRTEMNYAYNAGHRDALTVEAEELDDDLWAQWSEHATPDGAPLDDRVEVDSLAMHGQVAKTGEVFTQPPTSPQADRKGRTEVPKALVDQTWEHPPNRPNDRSTLVPWRPHWGIPGWVWRDGQRVDATKLGGRRAA